MLTRMLCFYLLVAVSSASSSLSCRWMDNKFRQYSKNCLDLLDALQVTNSTNSTEADGDNNTVSFPNDLYNQATRASAEDKLVFTVQVLEEIMFLFDEDRSAASWEESKVENFLNIVMQQANGLHSCIGSHSHKKKNKKLHMYFKRLSRNILHRMSHSAESWELIRNEVRKHLMRTNLLISPLVSTTN